MSAHLGAALDTAEIARRYQLGQSSQLIAKELGCSVRTVFVRLASVGVKARPVGKIKPSGPAHPRWKGGRRAAWQRWQASHPGRRGEAYAANMAVAYALRKGRLVRPTECEECGRAGVPIDGAHFDYSRPLEVRWLCKSCHSRWDHAVPKTGAHRGTITVKCYDLDAAAACEMAQELFDDLVIKYGPRA